MLLLGPLGPLAVARAFAGVLGVGAGTYFGLRAHAKRDESEELCRAGCTTRGAELSREAATNADWSTASVTLGLVSLGVGTYLVLSSGTGGDPWVGIFAGPGAVRLSGSL